MSNFAFRPVDYDYVRHVVNGPTEKQRQLLWNCASDIYPIEAVSYIEVDCDGIFNDQYEVPTVTDVRAYNTDGGLVAHKFDDADFIDYLCSYGEADAERYIQLYKAGEYIDDWVIQDYIHQTRSYEELPAYEPDYHSGQAHPDTIPLGTWRLSRVPDVQFYVRVQP